MTTKWTDLSTEVQNKILKFYELRLGVIGLTAVKNALTQQCFEKAIDEVLDEVKKRKRRAKADEANVYQPTDVETVEAIQKQIDAMSVTP